MTPLVSNLLVFGIDESHWVSHKALIKSYLQSQNMGWSFIYNPAFNVDQAVARAAEWEDLQLVYIMNERRLQASKMELEAARLARQLTKHSKKPWVILEAGLRYLEPIFTHLEIEVRYGMVEEVIRERWLMEDKRAAAFTS